MHAAAGRTRTMLAIGTLAAASAALWGTAIFDHLSPRADWTDGLVAATLSIITTVAGFSGRAHAQRERLRKVYEADRDLFALALAARVSPPRDGDGDQAPQRPAWVLYQEPAA